MPSKPKPKPMKKDPTPFGITVLDMIFGPTKPSKPAGLMTSTERTTKAMPRTL